MPADSLVVRVALNIGTFALNVAFDAAPGVTVLFGPSGSGKSTTLAAIAGLVRPHAGQLLLGDTAWFDASRRIHVPPEHRRVSLVFQTLALFPHLTALENVVFGLDRNVSPASRRDQARVMLERFRVAHVADRRPATYSGGEAQRVALARAVARSPRVLLLDEPFSALDEELRDALASEVQTVVSELEIPAIVVTHDRAEAIEFGGRIVKLREGRVDRIGDVRDVLSK